MELLYDSALASWKRVQTLDLRLQRATGPLTRRRLKRARRAAVYRFRRAYVEQRVRRRAA